MSSHMAYLTFENFYPYCHERDNFTLGVLLTQLHGASP